MTPRISMLRMSTIMLPFRCIVHLHPLALLKTFVHNDAQSTAGVAFTCLVPHTACCLKSKRRQSQSSCLVVALMQVAFLAGCLYTIVGILKLGWLTNFLSHSVISGFMSGASVIIALSQVEPHLLPAAYCELGSRRHQAACL